MDGTTGTVIVLTTPDAQRTMLAYQVPFLVSASVEYPNVCCLLLNNKPQFGITVREHLQSLIMILAWLVLYPRQMSLL